MATTAERLESLLGFDPGKGSGPGAKVLREAVEEIQKAQAEEKKGQAKELVQKAMEIRGKMVAAERRFNSEVKKMDKELGKLLNRIESMAAGKPACTCGDEPCSEETEEEVPAEATEE